MEDVGPHRVRPRRPAVGRVARRPDRRGHGLRTRACGGLALGSDVTLSCDLGADRHPSNGLGDDPEPHSDSHVDRGSGASGRWRHRSVQPRGGFGNGQDPRALSGCHRPDPRRQRLRQGHSPSIRVLRRYVGRGPRPYASGTRRSRLHDPGCRRVLRLLCRRPRAPRCDRERPAHGLVRLRPGRVAHHRPELDLRPGRWLRSRIAAGRRG